MQIFVERQHSGLLLSTVHNGYRVHKLFIGYTLREAKQEFRQYILESKPVGV